MGEVMNIKTKNFGEITIADEKIIEFPSGIIGFPELTQFALIHDEDKGVGGIHWLQSVQEPNFAMPVMDPLLVKEDYNPTVGRAFSSGWRYCSGGASGTGYGNGSKRLNQDECESLRTHCN